MQAAIEPKGRSATAPIGVFDSGVGGLTVLRALRARLPDRDFIYLGDTARLPYGTKSAQSVARYSLQCAARLLEHGAGSVVVACNTASAFALPTLRDAFLDVPISGVIEPGAQAALEVSRTQHIAVIGTTATIQGRAYEDSILRLAPHARVISRACSLFVALAEEGWVDGPIAEAIARQYLGDLFAQSDAPDTLVLGCTHFPLLVPAIRAVVPANVVLVDSAETTARAVQCGLGGARGAGQGSMTWLATDSPVRFAEIGSRFFGQTLHASQVQIVDL